MMVPHYLLECMMEFFLGYFNILKYIYTNLNSFILGTKYVNCHRAKVVENVHFKKVHEHKVIFRLCNDI